MAVTEANAEHLALLERKPRSLLKESFRRLFNNKIAVAGGIFIILMVLVAIFADKIASFHYAEQDLVMNNAIPAWMLPIMPEGAENYAKISDKFPLGADHLGRDLLSRTIYGARVSLAVAFVAATVSMVIGLFYGTIAGFVGGRVDNIMMRIVDFLYGFPFLILVILLQNYLKRI